LLDEPIPLHSHRLDELRLRGLVSKTMANFSPTP
jgi:hypothetical protein